MNDTNEPTATPPEDAPREPEPTTAPLAVADTSSVWLVSFADDDDRELRPPEIAEALRLGEITADTIVWRAGAADWLPLARVPELAKLLPSSGETATAPLVAPHPSLLRRADKGSASVPIAGGTVELPKPKGVGSVAAEPTASSIAARPSPSASTRPAIAGRTMPRAKGTTKLGIPKVDPTRAKGDATPLPQSRTAAEPVRAKGDATPLPQSRTAAEPVRAKGDATPLPKPKPVAEPSATPSTASVAPTRAKAAAPNIWGAPSGDEEPISIDPESLRPPSPAPARAMQRAKALSPGTLGLPKKKAPTPPRPPEKKGAAEPELPSDPGTPSLAALASPRGVEPSKSDDAILALGTGASPAPEMAPPTIDVSGLTAPAEAPLDAAVSEPHGTTPTESSASIAAPEPAREEQRDSERAQARPSPMKAPRKSALPALAAGAIVVALAWFFMHGKKPSEATDSETQARRAAARAAEPEPAAEPKAPETPEPAAAPSPKMEEPAEAPKTATSKAAEPGASPASAPKTDTTTPKEKKAPEVHASDTKGEAKLAETKPAGAKPVPAAGPEPAEKEVAVGGEFDKSAAAAALGSAAQEASGCRKEGDPSGVATVHVTFSNTGHATRAVIEGPPFAGTATGGCIASTLRSATVPPYGGDRVTVTKKVVIH